MNQFPYTVRLSHLDIEKSNAILDWLELNMGLSGHQWRPSLWTFDLGSSVDILILPYQYAFVQMDDATLFRLTWS
jgi:hypothetical protein